MAVIPGPQFVTRGGRSRARRQHAATPGRGRMAQSDALARAASDDALACGAEGCEEDRGPDGDGGHGASTQAARTAADSGARLDSNGRRPGGEENRGVAGGEAARRQHRSAPIYCNKGKGRTGLGNIAYL